MYKLATAVHDILILPTPLDISSLLTKSTTEKNPSKISAEVFLVVNNVEGKNDKNNGVKVVTFDLLTEKVNTHVYKSLVCSEKHILPCVLTFNLCA